MGWGKHLLPPCVSDSFANQNYRQNPPPTTSLHFLRGVGLHVKDPLAVWDFLEALGVCEAPVCAVTFGDVLLGRYAPPSPDFVEGLIDAKPLFIQVVAALYSA